MRGKLSPIILVVLLLIVVALAVLIFGIATNKINLGEKNQETIEEVQIEYEIPSIELSYKLDDAYSAIIYYTATVEEEEGLASVTTPDGDIQKIDGDKSFASSYEVSENGTYEFIVKTANGQKNTGSIEIADITERSSTAPYIPEGFSVLQDCDNVEEGFTIQGMYGNQFVWVPVESGIVSRINQFDSDYEETSSTASAMVNSVGKYYGYYIAKFEASEYTLSNGEKVAASMGGKTPWVNITYTDANDYSNNAAKAYNYTDVSTALCNSYAWDTALMWIDKNPNYSNYSSSTMYGNYEDTIALTGMSKDSAYNIFDLAGNVKEWTTETYKKETTEASNGKSIISKTVRGGSINLSNTASRRIGKPEDDTESSRGFRMILYK